MQSGAPFIFVFSLSLTHFLCESKFIFSKKKQWLFYAILLLVVVNPVRCLAISIFRPFLEPDLTTSISIKNSDGLVETNLSPAIRKQYLGKQDSFFYENIIKK
jgi:hypothetical protein